MISQKDIIADMHTHTIFSGHALSTLQENIYAAEKAGMKYIAVTDHYYNSGSALDRKNEVTRLKYIERDANPNGTGVYVIGGAEYNIGQEPDKWKKLAKLSWNIVGIHSFFMDIQSVTLRELYDMFETAADKFRGFAHIERNLYKVENYSHGNNLDSDIKRFLENIVSLAKERDIFLEVNESSLLRENNIPYEHMKYWLGVAKELECKIYLGSDAHFSGKIGMFENSIKLLDEISYPIELVLNCNEYQIKQIINK